MPNRDPVVTCMLLPPQSSIGKIYGRVDLSDSYSVTLPPGTCHDPEILARFVFSRRARWMDLLMAVRDVAVSAFGLKTSTQLVGVETAAQGERIAIFRIFHVDKREIILGEDDSHLDFRISVLHLPAEEPESESRLVVSTVVHCHNRLGRTYLRIITPFHRVIVRSILRRAARNRWPSELAGTVT
ncbi:MAG: DUF2867 domain-containing protein [Pseudoxanthomonas sp.]